MGYWLAFFAGVAIGYGVGQPQRVVDVVAQVRAWNLERVARRRAGR